MNIIISRKTLTDTLGELSPLAGKNKVLPIFNNVQIITKGNQIRLQTSDAKTTLRKYIEAKSIDEEGSFLVDCAMINNFLRQIKDDDITLSFNDNTLTITHRGGSADFPIQPNSDFVDPNPMEGAVEVVVQAHEFSRMINLAKNFVDLNDLRPQLKHICAIIENGTMTLCSTDTNRLFVDSLPYRSNESELQWYIEQSAFNVIIAACKNQREVVMKVSDKSVSYHIGRTTIFTQQIKGRFPDFKRVIPTNHAIDVVCDKADIIAALQRVLLFTESTSVLKLTISSFMIDLQVDNLIKLSKVAERVPCTSNSNIVIGVNAKKLLECVSCCESDEVKIELNNAARPFVLKDKEAPNRLLLCMPMTLSTAQS